MQVLIFKENKQSLCRERAQGLLEFVFQVFHMMTWRSAGCCDARRCRFRVARLSERRRSGNQLSHHRGQTTALYGRSDALWNQIQLETGERKRS